MLRLRAGTATLLIGPRSSAGVQGSRYCLDSETEIHQRLMLALQDQAARDSLRRFWAHWQGDARLSGITDQSIVDRIARMGVRGPLIVLLVTDTSVQRRDNSAARKLQVAQALQNQTPPRPSSSPVQPPAAVGVSPIAPVTIAAPPQVDRSVVGPPQKAVGDWSIAEKLTEIVKRTADSRKLSLDAQQQLKGMLSDPKFVAWLVGSLLVWFVSHFFVVGEIFDMLLAGAALVLSGAGIFFALQSLVGAAHLIGQFVETTRTAKDDKDLDAAADILAEIIVMIGITVLIAALTHATTRATSEGMKASTIRKPPPEQAAPMTKLQERPALTDDTPGPTSDGVKTAVTGEGGEITPRGFPNSKAFVQFSRDLRSGLAEAGYPDTEGILQGSAVTGKSFRSGVEFDVGRVSDLDVALAGEPLLQAAKSAGVGLRSGGTRTGPLSARDLKILGLRDLSTQLSKQAGRPVNFMIYRSTESAVQRAPSVILPH
jgi:Na+-transporting methylmalonyl-CoA/oxaloacetate decarboxylase gamma subunit